MFLCKAPSRIKWRIQFIQALCVRLTQINTDPVLLDVLCYSISDWFEEQEVDLDKYYSRYHPAIITQTKIGWFHVFTGHISQEWEVLQTKYLFTSSPHRGLLWSTRVVEVCLKFSIQMWELRNTEVHGTSGKDRKRTKLDRLTTEIFHLKGLQPQTSPKDSFLFDGIAAMLQDANSQTMEDWILSRRPAIYHSIKQAKQQASANTHNLYHWFKPLTTTATPTEKLQRWSCNRLVFDPFSKKKRHKQSNLGQQQLTQFFSPCKLK